MGINVVHRQGENVTILDIAGQITLGEGASELRDTVRDLVGKNQKNILLNFHGVVYIDSSGIGELVTGFTTVTNCCGQLKMENISKTRCGNNSFSDVLKMTQLLILFEPVFENDESAAIRSFR